MGLDRFTTRTRGDRAPQATTAETPGDVDAGVDRDDLPEAVARALDGPRRTDTATCDLCAAPIGERHRHVVEIEERRLECTCRACALLFDTDSPAGNHRAVPETCYVVDDLELDRALWASLRIPVDLAFLLRNQLQDRVVAFYPSPGGATESELELDTWDEVVAVNSSLAHLEPDVEALLVRRHDDSPTEARTEAWVVPVDRCYELIGHLRLHWHGFDGGDEVRGRISGFFDEVAADAGGRPLSTRPNPSTRRDRATRRTRATRTEEVVA